jgi:hypothetical protein
VAASAAVTGSGAFRKGLLQRYPSVPKGFEKVSGPFSPRAIYRFMTLAHELTHKIIKTSDKVYELPNCRAIKDSPDGVMCADSWGYFLTAYANTPDYALRHGAQQRRAAMGYDDD